MKDRKDKNNTNLGKAGEFLAVLPFIIAAALVVLALPKGGSAYKYQFEIGKPWQYGLLTATYDFPIYKTQEQIKDERDEILGRHVPYFDLDSKKAEEQLEALEELTKEHSQTLYIDETPTLVNLHPYAEYLIKELPEIYSAGLMSDAAYRDCVGKGSKYIVVTDNNISRNRNIDQLYSVSKAKESLIDGLPAKLSATVLSKLGIEKYLQPNLTYNNELTTKVKTEDLNGISTTSGMVQAGERIIDTGEIVTDQKYNILDSMRKESELREASTFRQRTTLTVGQIILTVSLFALLYAYLRMFRFRALVNKRYVIMLLGLMTVFLVATALIARLENRFYFYAIPYTLLPLIVSIFGENRIDTRTGLFAHTITVLLSSFLVPLPFIFIILQISAGMVTICSIKDFSQRSQFVRTAGIIFSSYLAGYIGYVLTVYNDITMFDWNMLIALVVNGFLLLLAYPLIFLTEKIFKFTSNVTLLELTNTNNPLLRELSEKAPGTFQHSMSVSNLAAEVAEIIGANPLLTRTGALYHDIGKMANPAFFTENQKNMNPHEKLKPEQSAQIIIKHVTDGVAIAKQKQLPDKIIEFIKTHHGKGIVRYFYNTWVNEHPDEKADMSQFSYPGPNPYTKEQGILMICDTIEAASRSLPEYTEETIDKLVDRLIATIVSEHYLDDAPLTLSELSTIKEVIKEKLHSIYHTRISYPELKQPQTAENADEPVQASVPKETTE